jgi:NAD(P)H-nitrite reductase large subunit
MRTLPRYAKNVLKSGKAFVLGGGVLGLEAAYALALSGLQGRGIRPISSPYPLSAAARP